MARRSITSAGLSLGAPCTCERKPISAYLSARVMPYFASCRLASTSWVLLPMDETIPIPVTTTRLMIASSASWGAHPRYHCAALMWGLAARLSGPGRLRGTVLEQRDFQVAHTIDNLAVRLEPAVRDAEHEFGPHHALDVDPIDELPDGRQHLAGQLDLARADGAATAGRSGPAEEESNHLPQGVEAETAGHHRVTLEMAGEKPKVGPHIEDGADQPLAILAACLRDLGNAVEHQHGRQRQLRTLR